jgi:D-arabinose 1-dehydrogenase-like Zn-dependent alcohol dehydrogenase
MKASVMERVDAPLRMRDIAEPAIAPDEALVRTQTTGICGTDLHILQGKGYVPPLPHVLGHEPAGVVIAVGADVRNIVPGDRVIPSLFFTCDECYYCRVGRHQQCSQLRGILGVLCHGAFAEYFRAPARNLFHLPDSIPFDIGGLISDAVVTALHATKRGQLTPGSNALVIGSGGVGLCLIQALRSAGVRVLAADVDTKKLELAEKCGASGVLHSSSRLQGAALDLAGEDGLQCVFDCVGSADSLRTACSTVMNGGRVVVIGEQEASPSVTSTEIAQRELEIVGSRPGTRQDLVEAIRLVERGAITPPIAARYRLDEANEALQAFRSGAPGRIVLQVAES